MNNTLLIDKKTSELYGQILQDDVFVVLDIETTGFAPDKGSEIIELAAVKVVRGRIVDTYESLIKPDRKIPNHITHITGITNEMVSESPRYGTVLKELLEFMGKSTIVAHNSKFEERFINHFYNILGIQLENDWICTMKMFNSIYPERTRLSLGSKLEDLTKHYNINLEPDEQHRALPDTIATALSLIEMRVEILGHDYIEDELLLSADINVEEYTSSSNGVNTFEFASVNYWEKCLNHKREKWNRRLYIRFFSPEDVIGEIYYDLYSKVYYIKKVQNRYTREDVLVDMIAFEDSLLKHLGVTDMHSYLTKIGVFKNAHRMFVNRTKEKSLFLKEFFETDNVIHVDYVKREIPYDLFRINDDFEVLVTNEKRGSKYRYYQQEEDIK